MIEGGERNLPPSISRGILSCPRRARPTSTSRSAPTTAATATSPSPPGKTTSSNFTSKPSAWSWPALGSPAPVGHALPRRRHADPPGCAATATGCSTSCGAGCRSRRGREFSVEANPDDARRPARSPCSPTRGVTRVSLGRPVVPAAPAAGPRPRHDPDESRKRSGRVRGAVGRFSARPDLRHPGPDASPSGGPTWPPPSHSAPTTSRPTG